MGTIDLDHLRGWIGKTRADTDLIVSRQARLLAATVDYDVPERIADGEELPPLWHWVYFLEGVPPSGLGPDGHPARGGFLPPVPLANRLWAGGRVRFIEPLRIGSVARKESTIVKIDHKQGRSGDLVFVTVLHELKSPGGALLVREEHDIVYRNAAPPAVAIAAPEPAMQPVAVTPDATMLFRYSALTFNGHRIHYDADYCRQHEGYANLVIHGPLLATLLASHAEQAGGGRLAEFNYRAMATAQLGEPIGLQAEVGDGRVVARATHAQRGVCMQAEARLRSASD
jgi:3-methylfumaryl-CoA hydratase